MIRPGPLSPDGGIIADWTASVRDPAQLAARLDAEAGVIAHGLFGPELVTDVVVSTARAGGPTRYKARMSSRAGGSAAGGSRTLAGAG